MPNENIIIKIIHIIVLYRIFFSKLSIYIKNFLCVGKVIFKDSSQFMSVLQQIGGSEETKLLCLCVCQLYEDASDEVNKQVKRVSCFSST